MTENVQKVGKVDDSFKAFVLTGERKAKQDLKVARMQKLSEQIPGINLAMTNRVASLKADLDLGIDRELAEKGNYTEKQFEAVQSYRAETIANK